MRKILLASHSNLAKGMADTISLFFGQLDNLLVMNAYVSENFDLQKEVNTVLSSIENKDDLIVITDLYGGSVNNQFINVLQRDSRRKFHLISGMNLPLLMTLFSSINNNISTEELIRDAIQKSRESIIYDNDLLNKSNEIKDEDF